MKADLDSFDLAGRDFFDGTHAGWRRRRTISFRCTVGITYLRIPSAGATFHTIADALWRYRPDREGD